MTFERLQTITVLKVAYTTESALAISAGDQPAEIMESPVIKLGGKPVIPGSSLKGALRSTLEAMLSELGHEVCIPFAAIPRSYRRGKKREQEQRIRQYANSLGRRPPCDDVEHPCPVCSIFGTVGGQAGLSGKALFLDATTVEGEYELIERSHVAITRDTKSQSEGSLMSLQAVDAGTTFRGDIRIINAEPWEVGAILRALEGVELLGIGAKKTAGYGDLDIKVEAIEVLRFDGREWQSTPAETGTYLEAFGQKFGA